MKNNQLQSKIEGLQNSYYANNKKNTFFKKQQKYDCAQQVSNNLNLNELLQNTIFRINNTNHIFFHYPTFKSFAYPDNFSTIVNYFIDMCLTLPKNYDGIFLHINWKGYTVSSHHRYTLLYEMFIDIGRQRGFELENILHKLTLYNPPSMLKQIEPLLRPIISPGVIQKIEIKKREESDQLIQNLFDSLKE